MCPGCSQLTLGEDFTSWSATWSRSGSISSGTFSAQPTSARRISESDSSSWPTPNTGLSPNGHGRRGGGQGDGHQSGESLETRIGYWPTPGAAVSNDREMPATWLARAERLKANRYNTNGAGMPLAIASQLWPTPTMGDSKASGHRQDTRTPTSHEGTTLSDAIHKRWPTPAARDHKGQDMPGRDGGESLPDLLMRWPIAISRPAQTTAPAGKHISPERRTLNPLFVEALMGWPIGWTGCDSLGMEWFRWWRRMRSALSRLERG
jgi:hypothetical protein